MCTVRRTVTMNHLTSKEVIQWLWFHWLKTTIVTVNIESSSTLLYAGLGLTNDLHSLTNEHTHMADIT